MNFFEIKDKQDKILHEFFENLPTFYSPREPLARIEKHHILIALEAHKYNRTRTAKTLGIGLRTLQRKLKQYTGV